MVYLQSILSSHFVFRYEWFTLRGTLFKALKELLRTVYLSLGIDFN